MPSSTTPPVPAPVTSQSVAVSLPAPFTAIPTASAPSTTPRSTVTRALPATEIPHSLAPVIRASRSSPVVSFSSASKPTSQRSILIRSNRPAERSFNRSAMVWSVTASPVNRPRPPSSATPTLPLPIRRSSTVGAPLPVTKNPTLPDPVIEQPVNRPSPRSRTMTPASRQSASAQPVTVGEPPLVTTMPSSAPVTVVPLIVPVDCSATPIPTVCTSCTVQSTMDTVACASAAIASRPVPVRSQFSTLADAPLTLIPCSDAFAIVHPLIRALPPSMTAIALSAASVNEESVIVPDAPWHTTRPACTSQPRTATLVPGRASTQTPPCPSTRQSVSATDPPPQNTAVPPLVTSVSPVRRTSPAQSAVTTAPEVAISTVPGPWAATISTSPRTTSDPG